MQALEGRPTEAISRPSPSSDETLLPRSHRKDGALVTDHTPSPTSDDDLRTRAGTLHPGSAFRDGQMEP